MQCYWEWLVGRVPSWIAPNLITIIGLATNVFTTLVLVYYCPTATEQVCLYVRDVRQQTRTPNELLTFLTEAYIIMLVFYNLLIV